ncbi:MAG: 50S ribosomal protein L21 [Fibrobacterota bacterium]
MYSIINIAGHQYKVRKGDKIRTELLEEKDGSEIQISEVLLVSEKDKVKVGTPNVEGASVKAKVVGAGKGKKKMLYKHKRRKDYRLKKGHRQQYTELEITEIKG